MQCFRNFPVAKKFMDKRGGKHQDFPSKNVRDKRGGKHDISLKNFRLPVPKKFVEEPFCSVFQKFSGSEKFTDKRGRGSIKFFR